MENGCEDLGVNRLAGLSLRSAGSNARKLKIYVPHIALHIVLIKRKLPGNLPTL